MSGKPVNESKPLSPEDKKALGMSEERNYTAERDSRVLPFVRTFLSRIGSFKFNFAADTTPEAAELERKSYDAFYEAEFMPHAMERKLRLTDMHHTFTMTKTVIEMMKARALQPGNVEDPLRVVPAAQEIFTALGEQKTLMLVADLDQNGQESEQMGLKRAEHYDKMFKEVVTPILQKYEVSYQEVPQVFAIIQSIIEQIEGRTSVTLDSARELAECKLWGVSDTDEVTIEMVHNKCIEKPAE